MYGGGDVGRGTLGAWQMGQRQRGVAFGSTAQYMEEAVSASWNARCSFPGANFGPSNGLGQQQGRGTQDEQRVDMRDEVR